MLCGIDGVSLPDQVPQDQSGSLVHWHNEIAESNNSVDHLQASAMTQNPRNAKEYMELREYLKIAS